MTGHSEIQLSLCMIVRNEAAQLSRCLSSITPLVSEIIIGDTGSSDHTPAIARQFGAKVIAVPWEDHFAKARNIVLSHATHPWIIVLDADEEADGWTLEQLRPLLQGSSICGYYLQIHHYYGGGSEHEYSTDAVLRLFRNDPGIRYEGRLHEDVGVSILRSRPDAKIASAPLRIKHYGYQAGAVSCQEKQRRNLAILKDALEEEPDQGFWHYALGTERFLSEDYAGAADCFLPLLKKISPHEGYTSDLYLKTAYALYACGRIQQAKPVIRKGLSLFPDFTDLLELQAMIALEQSKLQEASDSLQQALDAGDMSAVYSSTAGSGTYRTRQLAGMVCERALCFEDAAHHYQQAILMCPAMTAVWSRWISLLLMMERDKDIAELLRMLPQALTQQLAAVLVPAALNARSAALLELLCDQLPQQSDTHVLIRAVRLMMESRYSDASELLEDRLKQQAVHLREEEDDVDSSPAGKRAASYLWAAAWAMEQPNQAAAILAGSTTPDASLWQVQMLLETYGKGEMTGKAGGGQFAGKDQTDSEDIAKRKVRAGTESNLDAQAGGDCPKREAEEGRRINLHGRVGRSPSHSSSGLPEPAAMLLYAAQLLVQAGAWGALLQLVQAGRLDLAGPEVPQPLLCGLLRAPASTRAALAGAPAGAHSAAAGAEASLAGLLLRAALAESCGRYGAAANLLTLAATLYPGRPEPPAGLACLRHAQASRASGRAADLPQPQMTLALLAAACANPSINGTIL
ncbi:hypothetical protein DNH61_25365 [Paenibacillus sambharensis]|uniref:Glycosyltransferase 2-like domain-containing protein n=1 Tax=Paenibacillus sambharensis TaxID=1803190 RepID=A0A2W1L2I4_9BACL|nr:glycosyltransferase family 2 protein [Paenibacillus sambharensis]PZD93109.1 hypothetical protein DNH61_25365 [Paenibacillus sambharensis]